MTNNLLNITPGISISEKNDNMGQIYNTPKNKNFADIFVVSRYIYKSDNPLENLNKLLESINL